MTLDPAAMSAMGLPLDRLARILDKYKEVGTGYKLLSRGSAGKFPTKKLVDAAAKALRANALK